MRPIQLQSQNQNERASERQPLREAEGTITPTRTHTHNPDTFPHIRIRCIHPLPSPPPPPFRSPPPPLSPEHLQDVLPWLTLPHLRVLCFEAVSSQGSLVTFILRFYSWVYRFTYVVWRWRMHVRLGVGECVVCVRVCVRVFV